MRWIVALLCAVVAILASCSQLVDPSADIDSARAGEREATMERMIATVRANP
jgi:hypothetical protein